MLSLQGERKWYHACAIAHRGSHEQLAKALATHGTWEHVWEKVNSSKSPIDFVAEEQKLDALGAELILKDDPSYPPLLREIEHAPFGIYVRGTLPSRDSFPFAIVGTRNATESSKELAEQFAGTLSRAGMVIISGLALGIDASSHEGALEASGITIAVVATGIDQYYPRANESLGKRIIQGGGTIISEYPPGMPALPHQFLERNRIVSGMSKGILVIEAPARSGSLATARFALEQNRDVFVIPGSARHPNFKGSHALIRQGAELVTCPEDIISAYGMEGVGIGLISPIGPIGEEARAILSVLSDSKKPMSIDKIIELTHLEAHVVMQTLTVLTTNGMIEEGNLGYAARK
jgi:DNA processing protein